MPEAQPRPQGQQPGVLREGEVTGLQPEEPRRAAQQVEIADRLRRGERHQRPGRVRQPLEAVDELLLQRVHHTGPEAPRAEDPEGFRVVGELQQRQQVPVRLGQDPVDDLGVQPGVRRRCQQGPGVLVAQAREGYARELGESGRRADIARANTTAMRSADTRRVTNTSTRREASSIHWASSTTQQTGPCLATSCSSPRTARPAVSGSGEGSAPRPNTASRARCCTAGSLRRWSRAGAHSWCSVA
ncbi:hypothetical protein ADL21_26025 [Streptomyces albus subsp. albus]|nr:hypothetical protein ADL21_26025 [Streptomyces albus subsp. albus]